MRYIASASMLALLVSAPLSALVPVLMILFGLGDTTIVVAVFLFAVWIIVLDTRAGVRHIAHAWRGADDRLTHSTSNPKSSSGKTRRAMNRPMIGTFGKRADKMLCMAR